jgi:hypothetical protein
VGFAALQTAHDHGQCHVVLGLVAVAEYGDSPPHPQKIATRANTVTALMTGSR